MGQSGCMPFSLVTQYPRPVIFTTDSPIKGSSFWKSEGGHHRLKTDPETDIYLPVCGSLGCTLRNNACKGERKTG